MTRMHNNFLKTSDGEQIFYSCNFIPGTKVKNVLVFNYGLVCSNHHWKDQIKYFDECGYHILLHDYRGHYQSSGKHDLQKITIHQIAQDLNELIDSLSIESVTLLGHSMGVNICLEYARLYQRKVKSMILISGTIVPVHDVMMNTNLTGLLKAPLIKALENFPNELKAFWRFGGWTPIVKKLIHTGGFNVEQVSSEFIDIYLNKLGQLGPELFLQLIDQMQSHDTLSFVHNINVPTLIVGGNKDKVIPNYLQKLLHSKMTNSELYIIHTGSHVPQIDFPARMNERIEAYLELN